MSAMPQASPQAACEPSPTTLSPDQKEVRNLLYGMHQDPTLQGISWLGKDGVLRSLDADRNVVDAVPLRPELIKAFFETMPLEAQQEYQLLKGVDGRDVPKEKWFDSGKEMLPPPLEAEHRERDPAKLEEYRRMYFERRSKLEKDGLLGPSAGEAV